MESVVCTCQIGNNLFPSMVIILIYVSYLRLLQGSVVGSLLFLIYINDLQKAIHHCKVHHFANDRNLFHTNQSLKNLNKLVNRDMKQLNNWLSANKDSLNVEKTELIIFKSPRKVIFDKSKIKLLGKDFVHQTQSNISV